MSVNVPGEAERGIRGAEMNKRKHREAGKKRKNGNDGIVWKETSKW